MPVVAYCYNLLRYVAQLDRSGVLKNLFVRPVYLVNWFVKVGQASENHELGILIKEMAMEKEQKGQLNNHNGNGNKQLKLQPEHIQQLNKLKNNEDEQLDKLVAFYIENKVTIDHLLNLDGLKLNISANVINQLAVIIDEGNDKVKANKNKEGALKLYEYAAEKGYYVAQRNAGLMYLYDKTVQENIEKAISFLKKAAGSANADDKDNDCQYLLGQAYFKHGNLKQALIEYEKVKANNENFMEAKKSIKLVLGKQLEKIYDNVTLTLDSQLSKLSLKDEKNAEVKSAEIKSSVSKKPGLFSVSSILDGYDSSSVHSVLIEKEIKYVQFKAANQAVALISDCIIEVEKNNSSQEVIEALKKKQEELQSKHADIENNYQAARKAYEDLMNATGNREFKRQVQTEKHYFSPHRTRKKQTLEIAKKLQKNRLAENSDEVKSIIVDAVPARRVITAEISTIEASLRLYGRSAYRNRYRTELGWTLSCETSNSYTAYTHRYGCKEKIQLGISQIKYRQRLNPHDNHLGDYHMEDLGNYDRIISIINSVTGTTEQKINKENEKKLAAYMLRYSKKGQGVTVNELKIINPMKTNENIEEDTININRIFYHCFVKEIARWMLPEDPENEMPFATAQLRAIKLIQEGYLSVKEVFAQYAPYGVFTGKNIGEDIDIVKKKISAINRLYVQFILKLKSENLLEHINFFKEHKNAEFVTTRKQLHQELREGYGSGSDTDGDGYDSDTAERLYSGAFSF